MAVAPTGDAAAFRAADGKLKLIGKRPGAFAAEQWLRADADARTAGEAGDASACDKLGCVGILSDGRVIALVFKRDAFAEDCRRADVIVTKLLAPQGCAAPLIIDHDKLKETGALTLSFGQKGVTTLAVRAADEDRPWSRAPKRGWGKSPPLAMTKTADGQTAGDEPEPTEDSDESPLD